MTRTTLVQMLVSHNNDSSSGLTLAEKNLLVGEISDLCGFIIQTLSMH